MIILLRTRAVLAVLTVLDVLPTHPIDPKLLISDNTVALSIFDSSRAIIVLNDHSVPPFCEFIQLCF